MHRITRTAISLIALTVSAACASSRGAMSASVSSLNDGLGQRSDITSRAESPCADCSAIPMPTEITKAVETRIADLKARGGECSRYGEVLESSYRSGQITIRPYMWRVGTHLASGEAKPNGQMTLAREIDSLNVGVRTVDDVLWTMEHEAAHIAFDLASGNEASEDKANQTVRACKS